MSMDTKEKVHDVGLTEVYCSPDPQVDVVFVHGLNGHPYNTWASHGPEVFWPADLLPSAVKDQQCRILTYGYNANVTAFTDGVSRDHIHNHAEHLAARLVANRSVKARERPIIFVAHSLGGLVVKRLLIYCESINNPKLERLRSIYVSTFGILFLGTPHNGSDLAKFGSILQSIAAAALPRRFFDSSSALVDALKSNNETLQNINRLFIEIMEPFRIYFFHEQKPMDLKTTRRFIVEEESAAPLLPGVERMGIEKDHSTMCKFEDANAPGFDVIADAISSYAEEAPRKIKLRWERELRVREYYRQSLAGELLGLSVGRGEETSQHYQNPNPQTESAALNAPGRQQLLGNASSADSYVVEESNESPQSSKLLEPASSQHSYSSQKQPRVAPLLFRPNSIFVGFDIELDQLKHKLSVEKKTEIGTCAVLICGPPGSGKSHLARQFVWNQQADYPAGIFWVDCKSRQSIDRYYWDIGQALGCLEGDHGSSAQAMQNNRSFVLDVRRHLETRQGWIIVFDGIFFDSDEALTEFVQYLPDSPGNSIIYTSIDPTLRRRHRLLSPSWVRMRPLDARAARSLLFKSLGLHQYTSTQLRKANELIRYYRCLPLGIHAAAHMLEAQGRALEKFSPATTDKRLANPFLEIVHALDRRGYTEAVTLLALLSFLNHKVPVVLLRFGLPMLTEVGHTVESTDRVGSVEENIDNTISVLLRYGLVERELQTCSVSSPDHLKMSPQLSRAATAASIAYSTPTIPSLPEDASDLKLVPTVDGDGGSDSSKSVSIAIDTLRVHNVTQVIVREEVKASSLQGLSYDQWLVLACRFLQASFRRASTKLEAIPGKGSVADYREFKMQVTTLWKHMPRSHKAASVPLVRAREELRNMYRTIQDEISRRSPSQSQSSKDGHFKYIGSVFETSASSLDEELHTPTSGLTRTSTWSSGKFNTESESPIQYHVPTNSRTDAGIPEFDQGYDTDLDDLTSDLQSSHRWSAKSDMTDVPDSPHERTKRQALLQAILRGHCEAGRTKDLGEFKPVPTIGKIQRPRIATVRPRSSSASSTKSTAEVALAAVQARSPSFGASKPEGKKPATGSAGKVDSSSVATRMPLDEINNNQQLSLVAADDMYTTADTAKASQDPRKLSKTSTSPRLINAVLARQAARYHDGVPIEENITITRRYPSPLPRASYSFAQTGSYDTLERHPSGYMSLPMSRDASHESHISQESAPTEPLHVPSSSDSAFFSGYSSLAQAQAIPSIDVAMAHSLDVGSKASWAPVSPIGLEDDLPSPGLHGQQTKIIPTSAPASAPASPRLATSHVSQGSLDIPETNVRGKERAS